MFEDTLLYANGKEPVIEEQDVYRIEIPIYQLYRVVKSPCPSLRW